MYFTTMGGSVLPTPSCRVRTIMFPRKQTSQFRTGDNPCVARTDLLSYVVYFAKLYFFFFFEKTENHFLLPPLPPPSRKDPDRGVCSFFDSHTPLACAASPSHGPPLFSAPKSYSFFLLFFSLSFFPFPFFPFFPFAGRPGQDIRCLDSCRRTGSLPPLSPNTTVLGKEQQIGKGARTCTAFPVILPTGNTCPLLFRTLRRIHVRKYEVLRILRTQRGATRRAGPPATAADVIPWARVSLSLALSLVLRTCTGGRPQSLAVSRSLSRSLAVSRGLSVVPRQMAVSHLLLMRGHVH